MLWENYFPKTFQSFMITEQGFLIKTDLLITFSDQIVITVIISWKRTNSKESGLPTRFTLQKKKSIIYMTKDFTA